MRYSILVTAAMLGPLAAASMWANSDAGQTQRILERQCEAVKAMGVYCDQAQAPRPRRPKADECGARA